MNEDPITEGANKSDKIRSTQGMTARVVKGSAWTMVGTFIPLAISFMATPFVIRRLGSEGYGVFALIGLIPTYFAFADFGMNMASTKFGSQAYAMGCLPDEAEVIRTAAVITFLTSLPIAILLFIFSTFIVVALNVPLNLQYDASLGLQFASVTFVINFLNNVLNSPQLARLRMDLNILVTSSFRTFGIVGVPIVLYFGGGIAYAVFILMVASLFTLIGHIVVSGRLNPALYGVTIDSNLIKPLLKFGSALSLSAIAGVLLVNLEKVVLTRVTSVQVLAYYTVAFTFASMATMFTGSMAQSLIPAFSQLLLPEKREQLNRLIRSSLRINVFGLLPVIGILFIIAKPFFTVWAGDDFGRESTWPFYILLTGLFFNLNAYIPGSLLLAAGRTDILAKVFWIELVPYIFVAGVLTTYFGAVGAATAWSLRVVADCLIVFLLAKRLLGVQFRFVDRFQHLVFGIAVLSLPILIAWVFGFSGWALMLSLVCTAVYPLIIWRSNIDDSEKTWLQAKLVGMLGRFGWTANR